MGSTTCVPLHSNTPAPPTNNCQHVETWLYMHEAICSFLSTSKTTCVLMVESRYTSEVWVHGLLCHQKRPVKVRIPVLESLRNLQFQIQYGSLLYQRKAKTVRYRQFIGRSVFGVAKKAYRRIAQRLPTRVFVLSHANYHMACCSMQVYMENQRSQKYMISTHE